jgi:hypothetical protein
LSTTIATTIETMIDLFDNDYDNDCDNDLNPKPFSSPLARRGGLPVRACLPRRSRRRQGRTQTGTPSPYLARSAFP